MNVLEKIKRFKQNAGVHPSTSKKRAQEKVISEPDGVGTSYDALDDSGKDSSSNVSKSGDLIPLPSVTSAKAARKSAKKILHHNSSTTTDKPSAPPPKKVPQEMALGIFNHARRSSKLQREDDKTLAISTKSTQVPKAKQQKIEVPKNEPQPSVNKPANPQPDKKLANPPEKKPTNAKASTDKQATVQMHADAGNMRPINTALSVFEQRSKELLARTAARTEGPSLYVMFIQYCVDNPCSATQLEEIQGEILTECMNQMELAEKVASIQQHSLEVEESLAKTLEATVPVTKAEESVKPVRRRSTNVDNSAMLVSAIEQVLPMAPTTIFDPFGSSRASSTSSHNQRKHTEGVLLSEDYLIL